MDHIVIEGVRPYDGRYEFDLHSSSFTVREWGWIKRHSGYLPVTLWDGLQGSDAELLAVFALIALVRAGKVDRDDTNQVWERFADSPGVVTVRLDLTASDEDDDPLAPGSSNGNESISGTGSTQSSGNSGETLLPSGIRGSATSASHPAPASAT